MEDKAILAGRTFTSREGIAVNGSYACEIGEGGSESALDALCVIGIGVPQAGGVILETLTVDEGVGALAAETLIFGSIELAFGNDGVIEAEPQYAQSISFVTSVAEGVIGRALPAIGGTGKDCGYY